MKWKKCKAWDMGVNGKMHELSWAGHQDGNVVIDICWLKKNRVKDMRKLAGIQ